MKFEMRSLIVLSALFSYTGFAQRLDPFGPACLTSNDCPDNLQCLNSAGAERVGRNNAYFFCAEPASCIDTEPRSLSGECNNVGAGRRLYGARLHLQTPVIGVNGELGQPSQTVSSTEPRRISDEVNQQYVQTPNQFGNSHLLITWGQFVDHDFTLLETEVAGQTLITGSGDLADFEIFPSIQKDGFFPNAITVWFDLSQVYGSDDVTAQSVRGNSGGLMLLDTRADGQEYMPLAAVTGTNVAMGDVLPEAFAAGDIRVNEQPILTSYHTLFVREHNRLARTICSGRNGDEEIFQCARRWNIAQYTNIVLNEYFPTLHGAENAIPDYTGYDPTIQPDMSTFFSTASYRFGHSGIMDNLARISADGRTRFQPLRNGFFNPNDFEMVGGVDGYFRGAISQCHEVMDTAMVDSMRNFLFDDVPSEEVVDPTQGLDLAALNIERGREHEIESYTEARRLMGLPAVTTFTQVVGPGRQYLVDALNSVYGTNNVAACDAWVCMLAEPATRGQMGETMYAFQLDQFTRLRDGDRFYFENTDVMVLENNVPTRAFTDPQIDTIRRTFLADIITRNTGMAALDNAFNSPSGCCESSGVTGSRQICVPSEDGLSARQETRTLEEIDTMTKSLDSRAFFPGTMFLPTETFFDCNCQALDLAANQPIVTVVGSLPPTAPGAGGQPGVGPTTAPNSASSVSTLLVALVVSAVALF